MSLWLDEKYLNSVSPQLEQFKKRKNHEWNFRCPLCGDSEKNRFKARGYVYPKRDTLMFKCHNCSVALPFAALLKRLSRRLYDEYTLETLRLDRPIEDAPEPIVEAPVTVLKPFTEPFGSLSGRMLICPLDAAATLADDAPMKEVYRFAKNARQLPDAALPRLFATFMAHTWLEPLVGEEKASKVADGIGYLVQPFRLPGGEWYGAQLRMLARKEYLTFRWSHDPLKMFGLEAWNPKDLTYVVEGPIDALFVPNAISPCGSDLLTGVQTAEEVGIIPRDAKRVYVWDNEPKNAEVRRHIRTAIKLHEPVVIWPRGFPKDINDMVREGIDPLKTMVKRTFQGLSAELEYTTWAR